ncbi:hypothetical protein Tsubulata_031152 [Turnera subulata]|uniref:Uncharacterized protein n=1 Tax=Turnera subulata TaxID=218843 RepID=A0A9Q0GJJ7_9ROSI|nr:hypothetical protein Tsubulata_031152 [Turnera subulata]
MEISSSKVDGCYRNLQKKRITRCPAGFPILTKREKIKTGLDVFLGNNIDEEVSDFQAVGSYASRSCKVYRAGTVITEMDDNLTVEDFFKCKDNFRESVDEANSAFSCWFTCPDNASKGHRQASPSTEPHSPRQNQRFVKRWSNQVQETVQFHALALLH